MTDRVYYNIGIPYISKSLQGNCSAEQRLNEESPILDKANDWQMSVVRFDIPTSQIPILIPDIRPFPNVNINETIYSVVMEYNGDITSKSYVQYVTSKPNSTLPNPPTASKLFVDRSDYYFIYSINHFLKMINTVISDAFGKLSAPPGGSVAPTLTFNSSTNRFTLNSDVSFYSSDLATPIKLYFNNALFSFFEGFNCEYFGRQISDGRDVMFRVYNDLQEQEYPTVISWNCLRSLQLRSSMMGINNEFVPNKLGTNGLISSSSPILADFIPLFDNSSIGSSVARSSISYTVNSSHRLINLLSDQPLRKVSLEVYWVDEQGNEYLLPMNYRESVTCKLCFFRKGTISG